MVSAFLHVPTLLVSASVGTFCVGAGLALLWRSSRSDRSPLFWSIGFALSTTAMLLIALRGYIPTALSLTFSNALIALSSGMIWLGYRRFANGARFDGLLASLGMLIWLCFSLDTHHFADINSRLFIIASIQAAYLVSICFTLVAHHRQEPLTAILLTAAVTGGHALLQVLRAAYGLMGQLPVGLTDLPSDAFIGITMTGSAAFAMFIGLLQLSVIGQRSERRLRLAAETDLLTGLSNRRRLLDLIVPRLACEDDRGALILFDIDHFKQVNDRHGHLIGDQALVRFADVLADSAPAGSIAARIGGEEFALFLPDASTIFATELADIVRRRARGIVMMSEHGPFGFSVSCGVAGVRETGYNHQALHAAADAALYKAKSDGRDRVSVHRWRPSTTQLTLASNDLFDQTKTAVV